MTTIDSKMMEDMLFEESSRPMYFTQFKQEQEELRIKREEADQANLADLRG